MNNFLSKLIRSNPIGRLFNLRGKNVAWKKVRELKPGMKIAVPLSVLGSRLSDSGQSVVGSSVSETDRLKTGKLKSENRQQKTDNRNPDIFWDEIVSVRKVGRERVWDIEVEGTHNFVGNGIIAHNTSGILLRAGSAALQLSSSATSTTADIQLAAADKISLFSSSFSLTTSSMTDGDIKLDSAGTLTISTSRNNTNIALMPGTGGVALGISTPNSSATLDLSSTTKGLLPPRMTTTQRDNISSPAKGLIVMNDSTNQLNIYNGSSWVPVGAGGGSCNSSSDCLVVLTPEYPNTIISADGTNNVGTLTSDLTISASNYYYNYYEFASGQASLQDYDVYVSWQLPSGWADWDDAQNAISIDLATEDASSANNKVDVTVYRQGDADNYAETANVSPTAGEWRTTLEGKSVLDITKTNLNTIATWAAGDVMVMKLKLYSKDNYYSRMGNIRIIYENQ